MLGISGTELVIILFFGFLIFGPEKLPQMGRTVGRAIRQFRQASDSMNKKFQDEVKDPFEEAVAPVRDAVNEGTAPIQEDINAINDNLNGIKSTITDPFKDAFKGTAGTSSSRSGVNRPAPKKPSVNSAGAAAAGSTAAVSTATAEDKPAVPEANSQDDAFVDPFANIANVSPSKPATAEDDAAAETEKQKPKGQPLPKTGGSVKRSLAASLYDLDEDGSAFSSSNEKGGE